MDDDSKMLFSSERWSRSIDQLILFSLKKIQHKMLSYEDDDVLSIPVDPPWR